MAVPRVFISSTCYDLKYIRENLKYFIRRLGYDPVLSEEGSVFFDPTLHTQDACLAEVPNCQMFVLIIGGRFGSRFKMEAHSITNAEYKKATELKIPVFALVEQAVYNDSFVYAQNKDNAGIDAGRIKYPSVDSVHIFDFIDEVKKQAVNNAIVPFRDFSDIESYLLQQWAAMVFAFLNRQNEQARVADTLAVMREMNERVEMLSRQILRSVGTDEAKLTADLYDIMLSYEVVRDLSFLRSRPTPQVILRNVDLDTCLKELALNLEIEDTKEYSIGSSKTISRPRYESNVQLYLQLRAELLETLKRHNWRLEDYLNPAKTPELPNPPAPEHAATSPKG
jgi:hypothetical protein